MLFIIMVQSFLKGTEKEKDFYNLILFFGKYEPLSHNQMLTKNDDFEYT